jgi:immune inhibitor A
MSISNWAIMEAGSWNGPVGGMHPAPFPLWFRYLLGWADPVEMQYDDPVRQVKVGQLSLRPFNTAYGIKINLPDKDVVYENPLGTGQAWWSDVGDLMNNTITQEFDLTAAVAPVFSFNSYWSIEEDWDAGYVEVSTDGGATWTALDDMDAFFTQSTLNGNNPDGNWNLTGEGSGLLRFDLAAYVGQVVMVRVHYATDPAVQLGGWWADDFQLVDGATVLFSDDVEAGAGDWIVDGWRIVPLSESFPRYYLVEWRNHSGFDRGLKYPYSTVYSDADEWEVDRGPYTVPGMLVYLRDTSYSLDYTLLDSESDAPAYGPKHGLALVDSHFWPLEYDGKYATGAGIRANARVQPSNAAFTIQDTTPFTLRRTSAPSNGDVVETKTFAPQPAKSQFHDSMGYYPGFYFPGDGFVYFWDRPASVVIPAKDDYTTRITDVAKNPLFGLYGATIGGRVLGSGNPGDDGVQYGLHLAVTGKAPNGSWGTIKVWNSPTLVTLEKKVAPAAAKPGASLTYTLKITNTSPVAQYVKLTDPVPQKTKAVGPIKLLDKKTNTFHWSGWIGAYQTKVVTLVVRINAGVPKGTVITNEAFLVDDATGATASVTATVK